MAEAFYRIWRLKPTNTAGAPVAVTGVLKGKTIVVPSVSAVTSLQPSTSLGFIGAPLQEPFRVLVINTRFTGGQPAVSNQQIDAILQTSNSHFRNCSYGRMSIHTDSRVVGPVDIGPAQSFCASDDQFDVWMETAKSKVRIT